MVALYVAGQKVGTLADLERLLPEFTANRQEVELRDDKGYSLGKLIPPEPICPWDPTLTREKLDEMSKKGGMKLADFWAQKGVQ